MYSLLIYRVITCNTFKRVAMFFCTLKSSAELSDTTLPKWKNREMYTELSRDMLKLQKQLCTYIL